MHEYHPTPLDVQNFLEAIRRAHNLEEPVPTLRPEFGKDSINCEIWQTAFVHMVLTALCNRVPMCIERGQQLAETVTCVDV